MSSEAVEFLTALYVPDFDGTVAGGPYHNAAFVEYRKASRPESNSSELTQLTSGLYIPELQDPALGAP